MVNTLEDMLNGIGSNPDEQTLLQLVSMYMSTETAEQQRQAMRSTFYTHIGRLIHRLAEGYPAEPQQHLQVVLVQEGLIDPPPDQHTDMLHWEGYGRFADEHQLDFAAMLEAAIAAAPAKNRQNFPNPDYFRKRQPDQLRQRVLRQVERIRYHAADEQALINLINLYRDQDAKAEDRDMMRMLIRYHVDVQRALLDWDAPGWDTAARIEARLAALMLCDGYPNPYIALNKMREVYQIVEVAGDNAAYQSLFQEAATHASPRGQHLLQLPRQIDMSLWVR